MNFLSLLLSPGEVWVKKKRWGVPSADFFLHFDRLGFRSFLNHPDNSVSQDWLLKRLIKYQPMTRDWFFLLYLTYGSSVQERNQWIPSVLPTTCENLTPKKSSHRWSPKLRNLGVPISVFCWFRRLFFFRVKFTRNKRKSWKVKNLKKYLKSASDL